MYGLHFTWLIFVLINFWIIEIYGDGKIVKGTDAKQGEFPFAVSLRYRKRHICGGTIINEKFILSAAHCVCSNNSPKNSSEYSIQYGVIEITPDSTNSVNIKQIYCHQFDANKIIYDCAVLELENSIPQDNTWKPVELSKNFNTINPQTGTIIGWGKTGPNAPGSTTLQKLKVDIYDDKTCGTKMKNEHHICFGAMDGGACNGDSGTALLVNNQQVGIASFITSTCGIANPEQPNVYSRVATYYKWINEKSNIIK